MFSQKWFEKLSLVEQNTLVPQTHNLTVLSILCTVRSVTMVFAITKFVWIRFSQEWKATGHREEGGWANTSVQMDGWQFLF